MDSALLATFVVNAVVFTGIWLIHVSKSDAGVIDFYWGPGFVVIAAVTWWVHQIGSLPHFALVAAIALWATRLTWHLGKRHVSATQEDARYREMRTNGGPNYWWASLFKVFLLQAAILWMVAAPVHVVMRTPLSDAFAPLLFGIGLVLFAVGFTIEAVADWQLANAKANAKHHDGNPKLIDSGLWAMSRHPNYFGELVLWWGLGMSAFAMSSNIWVFVGPALLTAIIVGISIPLTEQWLEKSRADFAAYKAAVPALVPRLSNLRALRATQ